MQPNKTTGKWNTKPGRSKSRDTNKAISSPQSEFRRFHLVAEKEAIYVVIKWGKMRLYTIIRMIYL